MKFKGIRLKGFATFDVEGGKILLYTVSTSRIGSQDAYEKGLGGTFVRFETEVETLPIQLTVKVMDGE